MLFLGALLHLLLAVAVRPTAGLVVASESTWNISNAEDLQTAVNSGSGTVVLEKDINLTATIDILASSNLELVIDGQGFKVDGQGTVRCFCVRLDSTMNAQAPNQSAYVSFHDIVITGGFAPGSDGGGGVYIYGSDLHRLRVNFTSSSLVGNTASLSSGGALCASYAVVHLDTCDISFNSANKGGALAFLTAAAAHISASKISNNLAQSYGGALYQLYASAINLEWSTVTSNSAPNGGAFYHVYSTGSVLVSCSITSNEAFEGSGGAFYLYSSSANVTLSEISTNTAKYSGGSFFVSKSTTLIHSCSVTSNEAKNGGGISIAAESETDIVDSFVISNKASDSGGGIYSMHSLDERPVLRVFSCILTLNSANNYGAAGYLSGTNSTFSGCHMTANTALALGGGLYVLSGAFEVTQSNVTQNHAESGAGLYFEKIKLSRLTGCEVSFNQAGVQGGGMSLQASTVAVLETAFMGNTAQNGAAVSAASGTDQYGLSDSSVLVFEGIDFVESSGPKRNTVFRGNGADLDGGAIYVAESLILVSGAVCFHNNTAGRDGGALWMNNGFIEQENGNEILFHGNHAGGSGGALCITASNGLDTFVTLVDIRFEKNSCVQHGGAISLNFQLGTPFGNMLNCEECGSNCLYVPINSTWRQWNQVATVVFLRAIFLQNSARGPGASGGAVSATNGRLLFDSALFDSNFASTSGGALYLPRAEHPEATTDLTCVHSRFTGNHVESGHGHILYSQSAAPLTFRNSTLWAQDANSVGTSVFEVTSGGNVSFEERSRVVCPLGSQISRVPEVSTFPAPLLPNWDNASCRSASGPCSLSLPSCWPPMLQQSFSIVCQKCNINEYSLDAGYIEDDFLYSIHCFSQCPYGGDCSLGGADLIASSGFYGALENPDQHSQHDSGGSPTASRVVFIACPRGYCCESNCGGETRWDSTCAGNRHGLLCGKCKQGYSASLIGAGCISDRKCKPHNALLPWMVTFQALAYAALFYYFPTSGFASPFALAAFYDQIVNQLTTSATGKNSYDIVSTALGFMLGFQNSDGVFGSNGLCAWPGMRPIHKAFLPFLNIVSVIVVLVLAEVATHAYHWVRHRLLKGQSRRAPLGLAAAAADAAAADAGDGCDDRFRPSRFGDSVGAFTELPDGSLVASREAVHEMPAFLQHELRLRVAMAPALNFSLSTIFTATASLLTCTDDIPGSDSPRLLIEAEYSCFQWWQYLLWCLIVSLAILVVLPVLYVALRTAKSPRLVSISNSMLAFVNRHEALKHAARLASDPFKPRHFYWLSVLIFHRVALGILDADVTLSVTARALIAVIICAVSFGAHSMVHPFKEATHNGIQSMFLFCSLVVAGMTVVPATCLTNAKSTSAEINRTLDVIYNVEAILLIFPIGFVLTWRFVVLLEVDQKVLKLVLSTQKKNSGRQTKMVDLGSDSTTTRVKLLADDFSEDDDVGTNDLTVTSNLKSECSDVGVKTGISIFA